MRTGIDFRELHEWIDSPRKGLGMEHRLFRHSLNTYDKKTIESYWESKDPGLGKKAVIEWLFHIAIDNISTAYKMSEPIYGERTFNSLALILHKNGFVEANFGRVPDKKIYEKLEESYGEEFCMYCAPGGPFSDDDFCPACGFIIE
jgi:hypothetical protein